MQPCRYQTLVVTGAGGFVGRHLLHHLRSHANRPGQVVAVDLPDSPAIGTGGAVACDLTDAIAARKMIEAVNPDGIIHLAGVATGADIDAYFSANVLACQNILSAVARQRKPSRVMVIGSAAQYGIITGGHEIVDEDRPLLGQTPYGLSKTLQEKWALLYASAKSLPVVCVRPFNIMGPGQPAKLVPGAFLHQATAVVSGTASEIRVGNTATCRDFTDVRDIVAAMWLLMLAGPKADGQVFNIASAQATRVQDILEACIAMTGCQIPVVRAEERIKTQDVPSIVGNADRLRSLTGWRPEISWRQSLADSWNELAAERMGKPL